MFEPRPRPKINEAAVIAKAHLLAGIFESAGYVGISETEGRKGRREFQAVFEYGDNDRALVGTLVETFGGVAYRRKSTYIWKVSGLSAIRLARTLRPYAVFRQPYIESMTSFGEASDDSARTAARLEIEALNLNREYPGVGSYSSLVGNRQFVAGVLLACGSFFPVKHKNRSSVYPNSKILSKNRPLLEAIGNTFGGKLGLTSFGGNALLLNATQTREIVSFTEPELVYKSERVRWILFEPGA